MIEFELFEFELELELVVAVFVFVFGKSLVSCVVILVVVDVGLFDDDVDDIVVVDIGISNGPD